MKIKKYSLAILCVVLSFAAFSQPSPKVREGDQAINFKLKLIDGNNVELNKLNSKSSVVLIVLRGFPEYQCPVCSRQVGQFIAEAEKMEALGAKVLFVYPGPSGILQEKANEFAEDFTFPEHFHFALDPDYSMINKYGLRWDAPKETAYPSAFVLNKKGEVVYSKISSTHGGRASVEEVLAVLRKL